ncbi:MAG: aminotransferase class V-fold PLP-dependent enzyme, partial [Firmicutes bacterium]|nr:aminotransferase class V-fold PLP-dependent enzyme [Bacillota bacterium]
MFTMNERVYNFYPGPATLPLPVLEKAQEELVNFQSSGMSVMENSHRSKQYEGLQNETADRLKRLMKIGDNYKVLFLQGGASLQFAMIPMNFLNPEKTADYLVTGSFAQKAAAEGKYFGQVHMAVNTKEENFRRIPDPAELNFSPNPVYTHITSNNTIYGT